MKCPSCSSEMDRGKAYVRGTVLGFLVVGLSHQHCWFEADAKGGKKIIVRSGSGLFTRADAEASNPTAFRCGSCATTVILGSKTS